MKQLYPVTLKHCLLSLLMLSAYCSRAQYVTIPDTNFVNWLINNTYCIHNGNQLDTTCYEVINDTTLSPQNAGIHDLTGVVYFRNLRELNCEQNSLTQLPMLPQSLTYLNCSINQLSSLAGLPASLTYLTCTENPLHSLPQLPPNLGIFSCTGDSLTQLPALPASIEFFYCSNNQLTSLPALPTGLRVLYCDQNQLSSIPQFPASLYYAQCRYNQITYIPPLPNASGVDFSSNLLTLISDLPDSLGQLTVENNATLTCLPQLKKIAALNFASTGVTCVPNYGKVASSTPALDTMPLCGIFNPNGCNVYWNISGTVYNDANANCTFDAADFGIGNAKIKLYSNGNLLQQVYSTGNGNYSLQVPNGTYQVTVDTSGLPFALSCPASGYINDTISAADTILYSQNPGLKCRSNGFDVGVQSSVCFGTPRPASMVTLKTIAGDMSGLYGGHCAAGVGGQVQLTFSNELGYMGPAAGALTPTQVAANVITWNIPDFGAIDVYTAFNTLYQVSPQANSGDSICIAVTVTSAAGDYNLSNNNFYYCFAVRNSLDPNEKEAYPTQIDSSGQWLTYTIHFQNTGNAPAINIIVTDTLDNKLDPSTFQLLAYSAKNLTQLFGNAVVFNFPNINLADSATSDSSSRGYVQYRIKTRNITPGQTVSNTAYIYFDYNAPIVTNTVVDSAICHSTTTNFTRAICTGDTFYFATRPYTKTGNYFDTLTSVSGCDSILALQLTVNPIYNDTITHAICQGDTFNGYSTTGYYTDTLQTVNGCDSIVTLALSVTPLPIVTFSWDTMLNEGYFGATNIGGNENAVITCNVYPTPVPLSGGSPAGGIYTGLDISNDSLNTLALQQLYPVYGVDTITYTYMAVGGCSAQVSDTLVILLCEGINQIADNNAVNIYPNPTTGQLFIKAEGIQPQTLSVFDINSRIIYTTPFKPEVDVTQLSNGVYFIEVTSNDIVARKRFVKM